MESMQLAEKERYMPKCHFLGWLFKARNFDFKQLNNGCPVEQFYPNFRTQGHKKKNVIHREVLLKHKKPLIVNFISQSVSRHIRPFFGHFEHAKIDYFSLLQFSSEYAIGQRFCANLKKLLVSHFNINANTQFCPRYSKTIQITFFTSISHQIRGFLVL